MKVPNQDVIDAARVVSLSRLQNEGSQRGFSVNMGTPKSIKATE